MLIAQNVAADPHSSPQSPAETSLVQTLPFSKDGTLRRRFMVTEDPVQSNIRVGLLLEFLDKLAEETALKYVRRIHGSARVVTAAIDDLKVCGPPNLDQDIVLRSRINFVGNTSVEVGIRVEQEGEHPMHLGSCYFTMVARLPEETGGLKLPPLRYESDQDRRRAARADERRRDRRSRSVIGPPGPDEWNELMALHERGLDPLQHNVATADRTVSTWERTYPEQENVPHTVFGGYIIHRAYMCAHLCAETVADSRALLVAAKRLNFYEPVRMGDKLHFLSRVTYTGVTSVSVETSITRISRNRAQTELSNTCTFTFVNVDENLKRLPVIPVIPASFIEDSRYLEGSRRRRAYLASKRLSAGAG